MIIQSGTTMVLSIDPSAKLTYSIYNGIPIKDGDLLTSTNTKPIVKKALQGLTKRMLDNDQKIIDRPIARGLELADSNDGAGYQQMVRTRGCYLDARCSHLISSTVNLAYCNTNRSRYAANGALFKDGLVKPTDLIVLATGFLPLGVAIRKLLGETIAKKVSQS